METKLGVITPGVLCVYFTDRRREDIDERRSLKNLDLKIATRRSKLRQWDPSGLADDVGSSGASASHYGLGADASTPARPPNTPIVFVSEREVFVCALQQCLRRRRLVRGLSPGDSSP